MTDAHDFDELASAHLDGATSPEEAARVASDPALQARVEELRAARDSVRELPAPDPERRDVAIAAALAVFDADAAEAPIAPVTPIATRRGLSPTAVRVLGVAAVFVLLALLVPLLGNLGGGGDADEASSDATSEELGGGAAEAATGEDSAGDAAAPDATTTIPNSVGGIGPSYADVDALAAAVVAGDLPAARVEPQESAGEYSAGFCPAPSDPDTQVAPAVVAGEPVIVWVRPTAEGGRHLTVLRADGCGVLDEREL